VKHGHAKKGKVSNTFNTWNNMLERCTNAKLKAYPRYGGRGITVCDRWMGEDGFVNFLSDMGERPKGYSLDRIDNEGNYEPSNCRWATPTEQARNRSSTRIVSIDGVDMSVAEFTEVYNLPYESARKRIAKGQDPQSVVDHFNCV